MSARSCSSRLARGGAGLEQCALAVVAGEQPALVADAAGGVRERVDEDGTAPVMREPVLEGVERGGVPLLGPEAEVGEAALDILENHAQILGGRVGNAGV